MSAIQKELETRGGLIALMAVIRRQLIKELNEVKELEEMPQTTPTVRGTLSRRRIEIQASLSFVQELEPYAGRFAQKITAITHPQLTAGGK